MAGGWPLGSQVAGLTDIGSVTASSHGTVITSGAANTKGSYTQLVASTTRDTVGILVMWNNNPCAGNQLSIDVAVGGSGSEQIIIPDISVRDLQVECPCVWFPIAIPASTRVAARIQSTSASDTLWVSCVLMDGEWIASDGAPSVDTYGWTSASTQGTTVDPGGTTNTEGAFAQLTASTTNDLSGVMLMFDALNQASGTAAINMTDLVDIAVGGAGSESVVVPNIEISKITANGGPSLIHPAASALYPVQIPSGTRLSVRAQCTSNTATMRNIGVTLYGVRT